ncbi:MAG: histidine--tRNA ligase [Bacteroidales bacterium]|jgi:histidyl-tRNA synthetase|nr:histidine--tRNA ligase [Bacteroidales bacterium]|tara:strand:+ start:4652 stop:6019 length:1368 start_codon:yes stop_codon:yes gene_type:complete
MAQKPSIPKGTRDFSPFEMIRRNYIFDIIKDVFIKYGYQPIETPAMESLSTLNGKYGEEGDRLLFKILNSGDFLKKIDRNDFESSNLNTIATQICEKGLRYDLTVPFARYVVQNRNDITFPFKRYQIQPVWRADRPQKGRYREFYQCDVDVIGSDSLLNEVELILIIDEVFSELGIKSVIKINNRKILAGIAEYIGQSDKIIDITIAIDKLEKIGLEKVNEELVQKGLSKESIAKLQPVLKLEGSFKEKFPALIEILNDSEIGLKGLDELMFIFKQLEKLEVKNNWTLDLTLARGLNYYTGAIIEVSAQDTQIGSICGGGRYDDLTGIFGLPEISGVGISFGADRIYDVMNDLNLFIEESISTSQIMLVNFGEEEGKFCLGILQKLRKAGIRAELYPDTTKMKKQMRYADQKGISSVLLVGEEEINKGLFTLKNMKTGEQTKLDLNQLIGLFKSK